MRRNVLCFARLREASFLGTVIAVAGCSLPGPSLSRPDASQDHDAQATDAGSGGAANGGSSGAGGTTGTGGGSGGAAGGGRTGAGGRLVTGGRTGAGGAEAGGSGGALVDAGDAGSLDASPGGGPCGGGPCTPVLVSESTGIGLPKSLTVDPTTIYWTTGDYFGATQTGIFSCPLAGCGQNPFTTLAVDVGGPVSLASAANAFYFSDGKGTRIAQCPLAGCGTSAITCASGQNTPADILTDGTSIYWIAQGMATLSGSGVDSKLMKASITGAACDTAQVLAPVSYLNNGLALDGTTLYFVIDSSSSSTADGKILSCSTAGCAQMPTEVATGQLRPLWVTASGGVAYWTQGATFAQDGHCNPDGAIWTGDAGGVGKVLVSNRVCPGFTHFDGAHLYWSERRPPVLESSILRSLPDGSGVEVLVDHVSQVVDMRVDATSLYWIGFDGAVWKMPK